MREISQRAARLVTDRKPTVLHNWRAASLPGKTLIGSETDATERLAALEHRRSAENDDE